MQLLGVGKQAYTHMFRTPHCRRRQRRVMSVVSALPWRRSIPTDQPTPLSIESGATQPLIYAFDSIRQWWCDVFLLPWRFIDSFRFFRFVCLQLYVCCVVLCCLPISSIDSLGVAASVSFNSNWFRKFIFSVLPHTNDRKFFVGVEVIPNESEMQLLHNLTWIFTTFIRFFVFISLVIVISLHILILKKFPSFNSRLCNI